MDLNIQDLELELAQLEKLVRTSEGRDFAASETVGEITEGLRDFRAHRKLDDLQWREFLAERIVSAKEKLGKFSSQRVQAVGFLDVRIKLDDHPRRVAYFRQIDEEAGKTVSEPPRLIRSSHNPVPTQVGDFDALKEKVRDLAIEWQLRKLHHARCRE